LLSALFIAETSKAYIDPEFTMSDNIITNSEIPTSSGGGIFFSDNFSFVADAFPGVYYQFIFEKVSGNLSLESIRVIENNYLDWLGGDNYRAKIIGGWNIPLSANMTISENNFHPGSVSIYRLKYRHGGTISELYSSSWQYTGNFQISIEGPSLSGAYEICFSGETHSITNYPTAVTGINWSASSNLSLPAGNSGFSIFSRASSSNTYGEGWLKPTYVFPSGLNLECAEIKRWVGKPGVPTTNPPGYPTYQMSLYQLLNISVSSSPGSTSSSYNWNVTGSIRQVSPNGSSSCMVEAYTTGLGNFYVTSSNGCGTSPSGGGAVYVSSGGGGGPLMITPNPADFEIELELLQGDLSDDDLSAQNGDNMSTYDYIVFIYDRFGMPVYNKKFQNTMRINISNWPAGTYHVKVTDDKKSYSTTFIVR
jgi:hypothetical protein